MSNDWLDTGHGLDASRLSTVFSRTPADIGGVQTATHRSRVSRSAGPVSVAIVLTAVMLVGSAGAVYAIRESLFPSLGAATSPSVWQNPAPPEPRPALAPDIVTTPVSTTTIASKPVSSTTVPAIARATPTSTSTIDDHGSDGSGMGSDDSGSDDSDREADDSGSDNSGSGSGNSGSGSGNSGSGTDDSGSGTDDSGSGTDDSGSGTDNSGSGTDNSGSGTDNSGSGSDDVDDSDSDSADD